MFGEAEWTNMQRIYQQFLVDILENKNLDNHLRDVNTAISDLENLIAKEKTVGRETPRLEDLKNDFYYLKYEILERL